MTASSNTSFTNTTSVWQMSVLPDSVSHDCIILKQLTDSVQTICRDRKKNKNTNKSYVQNSLQRTRLHKMYIQWNSDSCCSKNVFLCDQQNRQKTISSLRGFTCSGCFCRDGLWDTDKQYELEWAGRSGEKKVQCKILIFSNLRKC